MFQNLINNSIIYCDKEQVIIDIGFIEENDQYYKFYVKDNGPGIEKKYFDKIFGMFQTLEGVDKSNSTGIGLSIVKKIVDIYEGEIWVESEMTKGSTFFFTIKKR